VRNAEKAGASLVVVVDERVEDVTGVIMSDDGTGTGIRIPSMLIGKDSGKILEDFVMENDGATLTADFTIPATDGALEIELWYSSNNNPALNFIKEFEKYAHDLAGHINFTPRFVTWSCPECTIEFKQSECLVNGKYCAPNHAFSLFTQEKGRDILVEDLRQMCLHSLLSDQNNEKVWWDYMRYVHSRCYGLITEDCSREGHK
jgi:hypothetical protein